MLSKLIVFFPNGPSTFIAFPLIATLIFSTVAFAQIPAGYYDSATGTGYTLKTQLHNIINNHNDQGYNAMDGFISSYDLDNYYEIGSNTILDPYSENPTGSDPYTFSPVSDECGNYNSEGDCYNKEHIIPHGRENPRTKLQCYFSPKPALRIRR